MSSELSSRAAERANGQLVYSGLSRHEKAFSQGWDAGYTDGVDGAPRDSTLAVEDSWYAEGYRVGFALAVPGSDVPDEPATLAGIGEVVLGRPLGQRTR